MPQLNEAAPLTRIFPWEMETVLAWGYDVLRWKTAYKWTDGTPITPCYTSKEAEPALQTLHLCRPIDNDG